MSIAEGGGWGECETEVGRGIGLRPLPLVCEKMEPLFRVTRYTELAVCADAQRPRVRIAHLAN
jgi:hypothetical protein